MMFEARELTAVVTPVIVIDEVYKRLERELSEDDAVIAVSAMQRSQIEAIDQEITLTAADRVSSTALQWRTRSSWRQHVSST
jgi:hypothetical protein